MEDLKPVVIPAGLAQTLVEFGAQTQLGQAVLSGLREGLAMADRLPKSVPCRLVVEGEIRLVPDTAPKEAA